ncbi:hypothetical protein [Nocardia alni]|uniref:hypothetical protein n=1 Tax=Nocardia alni TaxID=2815723 RepID=UPI001C24DFAA|nr:hypothetical protein [Nocardia alni]
MSEFEDRRQAEEALALMRTHQRRTRRATRVPGWYYAAIFVFSAGATAANDFVGIGGAKVIAAAILVALLATLVVRIAGRAAPLSLLRGVAPRQSMAPRDLIAMLFAVAVIGWLIARYGESLSHSIASALGVPGYPNTVAGVLYAAVATGLFALSQRVLTVEGQRADL